MTVALVVALVLTAGIATGVVLVRDPVRQTIALALYGLVLAILFFLLRAPDVALSQIAVGTIVVPLILLVVLARLRGVSDDEPS